MGEPLAGEHLVEDRREAGGVGAQAWERLALAQRKFASDLIGLPLKVLCDLGGWKEARTVLRCYQHTDEVRLRTALDGRPRKVGA